MNHRHARKNIWESEVGMATLPIILILSLNPLY